MAGDEQRADVERGDPAPLSRRVGADAASTWLVVLANVIALGIALYQGWSLLQLLTTYWVQSVVIGWYSGRRILELKRFSYGGVRQDESAVDAKRDTVRFFAVHYGFFHVLYLFFLVIGMPTPDDLAWVALTALIFLLTHGASFRRNRQNDRLGCPSLEALMFLPYARVVPMHLTLVVGLTMGHGGAVLLFGVLKTLADVVMHWVEHRFLASVESDA